MTLISTRLFIVVFLIICIFSYILFLLSTSSIKKTKSISELIRLPGISLSTSYLGSRIREYKDETNTVYLTMPQDDFSDFVYDK